MDILTLTGIAAFLSVMIEVAKKLGVLPDGYAGWAAVISNIVVFAAAAIAGHLEFDLTAIDGLFATLAQLLLAVLGSFGTHKILRSMQIV